MSLCFLARAATRLPKMTCRQFRLVAEDSGILRGEEAGDKDNEVSITVLWTSGTRS